METSIRDVKWMMIDQYIEPFEAALGAGEKPSIQSFLPEKSDSHYWPVLVEMIRIDLEDGWRNGCAAPLAQYLADYPEIRHDASVLQAIAFEEYRQRLDHGDHPSAQDYARLYEIDVSRWTEKLSPDSLTSNAQVGSVTRTEALQSKHKESYIEEQTLEIEFPHAKMFRELQEVDPDAADRFANASQTMPKSGEQFLNFTLVQELGRGACGRVFLAHQSDLANRPVALKISADLHGESETLARLQHTNIMPIYSVHREGPFQAVCMPYFGSTTLVSLVEMVRTSGQLPESGQCIVSTLNTRRYSTQGSITRSSSSSRSSPGSVEETEYVPQLIEIGTTQEILDRLARSSYVEAVLWIGARLADGLAHAHERGIIHRDLKPANILLTDEGRPMLLDFNLSDNTKLRSGAAEARIGGTLPYMAPEHLAAFRGEAKQIDARSDIYSLGLILYQLLTGHHPYPTPSGSIRKILSEMVELRSHPCSSVRNLNPEVSPAVESIIGHCLEPDPEKRYQAARDLAEDLERQLSNQPLKFARETSVRERLAKWSRRHPRLTSSTSVATIFLVLISALSVGAWVVWNQQLEETKAAQSKHLHWVAVESSGQVERNLHLQQALMYFQNPDRADLERVIAIGSDALQKYPVVADAKWFESDLVACLSAAEQDELRASLSGTLFTSAEAGLALAEQMPDGPERKARIAEILSWNENAEKILTGKQPGPTLFRQRARIVGLSDYPQAASQWRERAQKTPLTQAQDYFLLASQWVRQQEFRKAMPLLQQATTLDPKHFWAWHLLGVCHYSLEDYVEAINSFNTCLVLSPEPSFAYYPYFHRGLTHHRQGRTDDAQDDLDQAIEHVGDLPASVMPKEKARAYLERALIKEARRNYGGAESDLTEVIALEDFKTQALLYRSRVRDLQNNAVGAGQDRRDSIAKEPTDEGGWNDRGLARLATDPAGALADFDRALQINPRYYPSLQNKASVLSEQLGKPEEAIAILNQLVQMYPGLVVARTGRGVLLARLGHRLQAHEDALQALCRDRRASTYYQAANIYALTSKQEPKDADRVWPLLAAGLLNGFGMDVIDKDSDMDLVRKQGEFRKTLEAIRVLEADLRATMVK